MKYLKITYPDINNGIGFRVTFWMPGCTHHCPGCHNAWTADYNLGKEFGEEDKTKLFEHLSKDYISGITFSGGDPLDQSEEVLEDLLKLILEIRTKFPEKTIWLYTGYNYEDLKDTQKEITKHLDMLVDGPYIQSQRDTSLAFRGSNNQRLLNKKFLTEH